MLAPPTVLTVVSQAAHALTRVSPTLVQVKVASLAAPATALHAVQSPVLAPKALVQASQTVSAVGVPAVSASRLSLSD